MVATLLRLRFRVLGNQLARHPGQLVGFIVGSLYGIALLAGVDLIASRGVASGLLAAAAGMSVAARMTGWQTLRTCRDPLVWSLHAGMAWVVMGLLLVAAGDLGRSVSAAAGLHALTAGAMGSMILAVMTRVGLGHTGRPLVLPRGAVGCYLLVHAGAAARRDSPARSGRSRSRRSPPASRRLAGAGQSARRR